MIKKLSLLPVLIALCSLVLGQEAVGTIRVGIVDADRVIQESIKGKRFFQEFEEFNKQKSTELQAKVEELKAKEKDFQAKVNSLSEEKRRELVVEMQNMETNLKRLQEDAKNESDRRLNDALERFRKELLPIMGQVAQEQNLDIIINHGPGSNLVYFNEKADITAVVVKKYDSTVQD